MSFCFWTKQLAMFNWLFIPGKSVWKMLRLKRVYVHKNLGSTLYIVWYSYEVMDHWLAGPAATYFEFMSLEITLHFCPFVLGNPRRVACTLQKERTARKMNSSQISDEFVCEKKFSEIRWKILRDICVFINCFFYQICNQFIFIFL